LKKLQLKIKSFLLEAVKLNVMRAEAGAAGNFLALDNLFYAKLAIFFPIKNLL
jgi:hypothetical protein